MKTKKITLEGPEQDIIALISILSEHPEIKVIDSLANRFFCEEIVCRNMNLHEEYVKILLDDWLTELVNENPLSEEERRLYIERHYPSLDEMEEAYFESEAQLQSYLKGEYHG